MESKTSQNSQTLIREIKEKHPGIEISGFKDILCPNLYHFKIETKGVARGFSSSSSPYMGLVKAYSEYVERSLGMEYLKNLGEVKTSNGFAAHTNEDLAKRNSCLELIERDALLISWFGNKAPYWLGLREIENLGLGSLERHRYEFKKNGFDFRLGILAATENKLYTVIGVLLPDSSKTCQQIGMAIDTCTREKVDISSALISVFQGVSLYANVLLNRHSEKMDLYKAIKLEEVKGPEDHLEYYLNPDNCKDIGWFLEGSREILDLKAHNIHTEVIYGNQMGSVKYKPALDLIIARSWSSEMQDYFVGSTKEKDINMSRVKEVMKDSYINYDLHPLA